MTDSIQIVEKPDWVSWKDIKSCLAEAHRNNREKGIRVLHSELPADRIGELIGPQGMVLVALDGERVVGTASLIEKNGKTWYATGRYGYLGFAGVIPEYNGKGIYRDLTRKREEEARERGLTVLVFNTNEKNLRVQEVAKKNGFVDVSYRLSSMKDHYDVYMAKWLDGCPYSSSYCRFRFRMSKIMAHFRKGLSDLKDIVKS